MDDEERRELERVRIERQARVKDALLPYINKHRGGEVDFLVGKVDGGVAYCSINHVHTIDWKGALRALLMLPFRAELTMLGPNDYRVTWRVDVSWWWRVNRRLSGVKEAVRTAVLVVFLVWLASAFVWVVGMLFPHYGLGIAANVCEQVNGWLWDGARRVPRVLLAVLRGLYE